MLRSESKTQELISKVPEITLLFWIIKILTTGMGEVFADYWNESVNLPLAITLSIVGLFGSLALQFSVSKYIPSVYWLVVVMISIFGTTAADVVSFLLGHSPLMSTLIYLALLLTVLATWYVKEKTLSIHSIYTRRREMFYWLTVLSTFALGTAAGDMFAGTLHLGFFTSGVLFSVLLITPMLCSQFMKINKIFAFWFSYIMTRPVGASFADWMVSHRGGLGLDKGLVSLALAIMIILLVGYVSFTYKGKNRDSANLSSDISAH